MLLAEAEQIAKSRKSMIVRNITSFIAIAVCRKVLFRKSPVGSRFPRPASMILRNFAIRKIRENLRNACTYPSVLDYRAEMSEGSLLSAMAFSQTGLGAIHGLAHPIGSLLHVPHGKACAILIPAVTAWNLSCCREEYAAIARNCGFGSEAEDFLAGARELCRALGIPGNFSEYGLTESHFDFIVKNCRSASMKQNPRPMSDDEVRSLLVKLL